MLPLVNVHRTTTAPMARRQAWIAAMSLNLLGCPNPSGNTEADGDSTGAASTTEVAPATGAGSSDGAPSSSSSTPDSSGTDATISVSLLIEDVTIIDGTGRAPVHGAVLVDGDRILDVIVGPASNIDAAQTIDGNGRTLVPGYVHLLTHISARSAVSPDPFAYMDPIQQLAETLDEIVVELADDQPARLERYQGVLQASLRGGVTTFVDSISSIDDLAALRPTLDDTQYPNFLSLGPIVAGTGHHPPALDGTAWKHELPLDVPFAQWEDELRDELTVWFTQHELAGVKVAIDSTEVGAQGRVPDEAVAAICEVAHAHERPCFFLAYSDEAMMAAAAAQADVKLGAPVLISPFGISPPAVATLDALQAADVAFLSTLWATGAGLEHYVLAPEALSTEPNSIYPSLPTSTHEGYAALVDAFAGVATAPPDWMEPLSAYFHGSGLFVDAAQELLGELSSERGLRVIPATSSGSPWAFHGTLPHELGRVSTEITSPMEVLSAVTLEAARIMHIDDDVGSVEPGKRADLVLLAGDPLTDPAQLGAIEMVIKSGVVVPTG